MGETVNETIKLILSLSVSGGLFALVLFALKPLMRNRLSKSFQYYIWLVVLLRFILPFSFGINLMDFTFNAPNAPQIAEETVIPNNNPTNPANINPAVDNNIVGNNTPNIADQQPSTPVSTDSVKPLDIMKMLVDNLLWIWLAGAVISAAFNLFGYLRFIRYIRGVAYAVEMPDCGAKVYKSRFAPTPMLVGLIRPRIYLPDIDYTGGQLNNILLHELTHLRRHDIWLKWFAALVVSIHWFNPIVYFMRREISRACELSCDESVIRNLDGAAKQSYGDTLISVVAESRYPFGVMSVTMCEEKTKLKERLIAIMNYKKKTKITALITVVLAMVITSSAFAFGANATGGTLPEKALTSTMDTMKIGSKTFYLVETEAQLRSIAQSDAALSRNYLQNADIVLENDWVSIGSDEHPFTGSYNGNGFTIIGLRYPAGTKKYTGLFGYTVGAEIANVTLAKLDNTNANGLTSGAVVAFNMGGSSYGHRILSDEQFKLESIALPKTLIDSYYLSEDDPVYSYLQNNSIKKFLDMWFAEDIDKNVKPQWNYDTLAPVQLLDHDFASLTRSGVQLYTMTFTTDGNRCGYILLSYSAEGPAIQKWSLIETTPYLYDLMANSEEIAASLKKTDIDLSTATATRVEWQDTRRNRGDRIILFEDGNGNRYICYLGDDDFTMEKI